MRKSFIIAVAIVLLALGGLATWHFIGHGSHGHDDHGHSHGEASQSLELDNGEKWPTDEHLRAGMSRIHERVKPAYAAYKSGDFDESKSQEIAGMIRSEVDTLIEKCNLEPDADAMLHIVIGDMLAAASAMEEDPAREEGMPKLVGALQAYSRHFDHPDF